MVSSLAAAGLLLDIVGAATLASAFMFKRPRAAYEEEAAALLDAYLARADTAARLAQVGT